MPTELTDYAETQRDRLAQAKKDEQAALAAAQSGYAQARAAVTEANSGVTALEADIARVRAKLAAIVTPADAEPLLGELSQKTVELHAKQAAALEAEQELRANEAAIQRGNAELTRLAAALAGAESALADATEHEKRRKAMFKKVDEAPLSGLAGATGAAHAALQGAPYTAAKARVEAEIPQPLRDLAAKRRENQSKLQRLRLEYAGLAQTKLGDELNVNGGAAGKAEKARAEFERAGEDLRDFVVRGKERFDHAQNVLATAADPDKDPLTDAQVEAIQSAEDEDLKDARADAAAKALAVENRQGDVIDAKLKVERAELTARATDVDADIPNVDAVKEAREELQEAEDKLDLAKDDYTGEMRALIDAWEAAVPDAAWRRFDNFLKAEAMLKALESTDANTLRTKYQSAEGAYGDALAAAAKRARTTTLLEAERARSAASVEFHTAASDRLLFGALRGDK